jgi:hypothetical protein
LLDRGRRRVCRRGGRTAHCSSRPLC